MAGDSVARISRSNRRAYLWGPVAVMVVLAISYLLLEWYAIIPEPYETNGASLSEVQKASLDLYQGLTKLFISWSLLVIGGAAYFLKAATEGDYQLTFPGLISAEFVILSAVTSIFFGHLSLNAALQMLALGFFNVRDPGALTYGILQYLSFLIALVAFFLFIHLTYWSSLNKQSEESEP